MEVPHLELNDNPVRHAHSCLSFSNKFFYSLAECLSPTTISITTKNLPPEDRVLLSIGSGTGLLESLILSYLDSSKDTACSQPSYFTIEGVEVQQPESIEPTNKYLPEPAINTVRSSREVSPRLKNPEVFAIMFVYPRQPSLVSLYIKAILQWNLNVKSVIWLGPVADWVDYEPCFSSHQINHTLDVYKGDEIGLGSYEMMAVWKSRL